jgi:hypothetical protein
MTVAEMRNGLRKILVSATPVMNDLWTLNAKPSGNLGGIHQVIEIHLATHNTTVPARCGTAG